MTKEVLTIEQTDMRILKPYQSVMDVEPIKHLDGMSRADRNLTKTQRRNWSNLKSGYSIRDISLGLAKIEQTQSKIKNGQ